MLCTEQTKTHLQAAQGSDTISKSIWCHTAVTAILAAKKTKIHLFNATII